MGSSDCNCAAAKALHCCVKGSGRASRGFVEKSAEKATFEDVEDALADDAEVHLLGDSKEEVQVLAVELVHGEDVALFKGRAGEQVLDIVGSRRQ